jgi:5-hydroxyisourate hydrolase
MGKLTTHVLDTSLGRPGAGILLNVVRINGERRDHIATAITNDDGRCDAPLVEGDALTAGEYEISFAVGAYLASTGVAAPAKGPRFLDNVVLRFGVSDASEHYHVPLLISPFAYSTYRGS